MTGEQIIVEASLEPEGQGDRPSRGDMRLMGRAIRSDWPISEETRKRVVEQLSKIVDEGLSERDTIAASKTLIAADALNAKREATDVAEAKPVSGATINIDNRKQVILRIPDNGRGPAIEHRD